jgi:hypothetical protein
MDDRKARIQKLSERFKPRPSERKAASRERRERRSFYLDVGIMERIDKEHKTYNHQAFPHTVNKSVFMEAILEYGMDNLDAVAKLIQAKMAAAPEENSTDE